MSDVKKPQRVGLSGPEKMFWDEMDAIGANVEASITRKQREWQSDLYQFQVTRANGSTQTGVVPWDLNTFSTVLKIAKGDV
jgi:ATP-dependent Zn protease